MMESNAKRISELLDERFNENSPPAAPRSPRLAQQQSAMQIEPDRLKRQRECKQRLETELEMEKKRLQMLQKELEVIQTPMPDHMMQSLIQDIQQLRNHCNQMNQMIDDVGPTNGSSETDQAFQSDRLAIQRTQSLPTNQNRTPPPPLPAALCSKLNRTQPSSVSLDLTTSVVQNWNENSNGNDVDDDDGDDDDKAWECNMCTFRNNFLLAKCEQCEMPHLPTGNRNRSLQ